MIIQFLPIFSFVKLIKRTTKFYSHALKLIA